MVNFINWIHEEAVKKKRKKNGNISNDQGRTASGNTNYKGQTARFDQEIAEPVVHIFTEP